jgi:hypothetical protein
MLLKVFSNIGVLAYKDIDKTFFRRRCAGGMKYLQFDISTRHPLYSYFHFEGQVEYLGDLYVIKGISSRSKAQICTINCELDLDGLDNKKITKTYTTSSFSTVAGEVLAGTGWQIVNADLVSRRTTLELQDSTPREILEKCTNKTAFGTCYEFDNKLTLDISFEKGFTRRGPREFGSILKDLKNFEQNLSKNLEKTDFNPEITFKIKSCELSFDTSL